MRRPLIAEKSLLVMLAVFALVAGACALPTGGEASPLDTEEHAEVVFGTGTTTPTTEPPQETAIALRLYFINDDKLEWVRRQLEDPNVSEVLDSLQDGPTSDEGIEFEAFGGIRTALPVGLEPQNRPRPVGSAVVAIDVSDEAGLRAIGNEDPQEAEFIYSQIVCTLTGLNLPDAIVGVEFYDSQGQIPIVDVNRTPIEGPARASDFNNCSTPKTEAEAAAEAEAEAEAEADTSTTES